MACLRWLPARKRLRSQFESLVLPFILLNTVLLYPELFDQLQLYFVKEQLLLVGIRDEVFDWHIVESFGSAPPVLTGGVDPNFLRNAKVIPWVADRGPLAKDHGATFQFLRAPAVRKERVKFFVVQI